MMKEKSDFTQGSVSGNIMRMAVPMTAATLINVLYSVVDRMYIGRIPGAGSLALTGIGLAFPILTMVTAFQNLFGSGGSPLFSMASGRGDKDEARRCLNNSAFMLVVTGVLLTAAGFLLKDRILWLTGASDATFGYADDYLSIYLLGTVFVMVSLGLNPYITAQGSARTAMFTVLIGAITNIVLDPLFIFVFSMGVKGAALATVISQGLSAVWVIAFLTGKKAAVRLSLKGFRVDFGLVGRIVSLGVTEFCFALTNSAVSLIYNTLLSSLGGDIWVGAMTVITSVREIVLTVMHGLMGAARPVISYNYGAKRYDRVCDSIKFSFILLSAYLTALWAMIMLFPGTFVSIFSSDAELVEHGKIAMRLFFCLQFMMSFQSIGQSVFTALGMAKKALFFSLFRKVVLVIPLSFILPKLFGLGVYGVFLSEPVSDLVGGTACMATMYFTVYRKLRKIPPQP